MGNVEGFCRGSSGFSVDWAVCRDDRDMGSGDSEPVGTREVEYRALSLAPLPLGEKPRSGACGGGLAWTQAVGAFTMG